MAVSVPSLASPPAGFSARPEQAGAVGVLRLSGDLDVHSAAEVRRELGALTDAGCTHLYLDCSGVQFLDSSALGVLIGAYKQVRDREGEVVLCALPERLTKVFRITGLAKVFIFDADPPTAPAAAHSRLGSPRGRGPKRAHDEQMPG